MTTPAVPTPQPPPAYPPAPPPSRFPVMGCLFAVSFVGNLLAGLLVVLLCLGLMVRSGDSAANASLPEKYHSGDQGARDKVAIVTLDGVILEGLLDYVHKQIEQAAWDSRVKAVVLRINSPGGTITASDDLYRRISKLKSGDADRNLPARPLIVSMGSIAASGGYYAAVPGDQIFAERSTMTGSIGVYGSFPNVKELGNKVGFKMNTVKAGAIKDSASMFQDLSPEERQVLQDMVDDAYVQFLDVVQKGRPKLTRAKMLERFDVQPLRPDPQAQEARPAYVRYRADGGVFTAPKAKDLGLIDSVGTLEEAIDAAGKAAQLDSYQAIRYQKRSTLSDFLLGSPATGSQANGNVLDPAALQQAFSPRLWYLAPGHEAAGMLAAAKGSIAP